MKTLALATSAAVPTLHADDAVLVEALARRGIRGVPTVWDAPGALNGGAILLRSVWDYHLRSAEFLAWVARVGAVGTVWNDPALVAWNAHKTYLRELEERGVSVVPTLWVERGGVLELEREVAARGWGDVVVKPAVSASAHRTGKFAAGDGRAAQEHLTALARDGMAMVQPYLHSVEGYGERSFIFIDSTYTHGVRRQPVLTQQYEADAPAPRVEPDRDEMALCRATLAALDRAPLYARIDVARNDAGAPRLMELELIEPRLYFREAPAAAEALAAAIAARMP